MDLLIESAVTEIQERYNVWSESDSVKLREYLKFLLKNKKITIADLAQSANHFALWRSDCLNSWLTGSNIIYSGN